MNRAALRSRGVGLLAVASLLSTAACGSTVQARGQVTLGGEIGTESGVTVPGENLGGDGLTAPEAATGRTFDTGASEESSGGDRTGSDGSAPGGSGAGPGGSGTGGAPSTGAGTGSGSGSSAAVAHGPGVTATSIKIGIVFCNDCESGNAALGAGGGDPGDVRRYYQVAIDDVNARGGVLGRKLVPVFHEESINSESFDASQQAACETFTNDNQVLIWADTRGEVAYQCSKKAGMLVLGTGDTGPTYERYPNLFSPWGIRMERLFDLTVKSMVRAGWHKPDAKWPTGKIGLITWDDSQYKYAMTNGYLKALRAAGLKEQDVRYITPPQSTNLTDASAAISNAVLSFQDQGIDHVFIGDGPAGVFTGAGLTFMFLNNAKSQLYYPRYGFNSNNVPDFFAHPKDQLDGMLSISYTASLPGHDQGIAPNPVRERCLALMRKNGVPVGADNTVKRAGLACEAVWSSEAILKRATAGTTLPKLIAAAESLSTSYRSPVSYGNRIGPGQHDGARLFRELRWDEKCGCIKYTSKPFEP